MTRKRSWLARTQRDLYLASRTAGDAQAIQQHRYIKRRLRRVERRTLLGWLSKSGL